MKAILRTLIALLLISAGLAWASAGEVPELAPGASDQVEQPQPIDDETRAEDERQLTPEDLLAMDPDEVSVGACCMIACREERTACKQACAFGDVACIDQCGYAYESCVNNC